MTKRDQTPKPRAGGGAAATTFESDEANAQALAVVDYSYLRPARQGRDDLHNMIDQAIDIQERNQHLAQQHLAAWHHHMRVAWAARDVLTEFEKLIPDRSRP